MLKGGCFCGRIRYETTAPPRLATICHCASCRRAAGAPMVAWFTVPRETFRLVAGDPTSFGSSLGVTRTFCPRCGTPLTFISDAFPDEIDITTASLDDPEAAPPLDHTQAAMRLSWIRLADGLPRHPGARPKT